MVCVQIKVILAQTTIHIPNSIACVLRHELVRALRREKKSVADREAKMIIFHLRVISYYNDSCQVTFMLVSERDRHFFSLVCSLIRTNLVICECLDDDHYSLR